MQLSPVELDSFTTETEMDRVFVIFVSLDDFYEAITFMAPSRPGFEFAPTHDPAEPDLSRRRLF